MVPTLFLLYYITNSFKDLILTLWRTDKSGSLEDLFTYQGPDYELSPDLQSKASCIPPTAWTFPQGTLVSDQTDCVSPGGTQHLHCVLAYQWDQEYQGGHGFLKCSQPFKSHREMYKFRKQKIISIFSLQTFKLQNNG